MIRDEKERIAHYNQIVAQYHAIHQQINNLLHTYDGGTKNMPETQIQHYRQLAQERDELYNEMRQLEQTLFTDSADDLNP